MFNRILLPPYESLKHLEGKGNYALKKYYQFPYNLFYKHKLKMVVQMMQRHYSSCLDFGSGPGIFLPELRRHAERVIGYEKDEKLDARLKFDLIVCSSVLEFCELDSTLNFLKEILKPGGHLIVASPMKSIASKAYFKLIKDDKQRHSDIDIIKEISSKFKIVQKKEWLGLYFALRAVK